MAAVEVGEAWVTSTITSILLGFGAFDTVLILIEAFVGNFTPIWIMKCYIAVAFALGAEG